MPNTEAIFVAKRGDGRWRTGVLLGLSLPMFA
jgi:hypothetical protein